MRSLIMLYGRRKTEGLTFLKLKVAWHGPRKVFRCGGKGYLNSIRTLNEQCRLRDEALMG
eukprot:2517256-Amphidinium_carterae.1